MSFSSVNKQFGQAGTVSLIKNHCRGGEGLYHTEPHLRLLQKASLHSWHSPWAKLDSPCPQALLRPLFSTLQGFLNHLYAQGFENQSFGSSQQCFSPRETKVRAPSDAAFCLPWVVNQCALWAWYSSGKEGRWSCFVLYSWEATLQIFSTSIHFPKTFIFVFNRRVVFHCVDVIYYLFIYLFY